ncbi:MAG: OmpA family protein [Polyangiaceae bacterium]|nr:OmpA family protein [Polyangiaceae bacterium]
MAEDEDREAILRRRARIVAAALAGLVAPACAPAAPAEPAQTIANTSTSKPAPRAPTPGDRDDDGIRDEDDRCPSAREDVDTLGDEDGCPETDFDLDGVADSEDRCPTAPGISRADRKEQLGCPAQPCLTIIPPSEIQILQRVEFASNSSKLAPSANQLLDELAVVLKDHPELDIEIHGHTDNTEQAAMAAKRAEAVKAALLQKGVEERRILSVKGFGRERPIEPNDGPEGRAKNRRVEFKVVSRD